MDFYEEHKDEFGQFVEAWAFDPNSDEAVVAGFFRPQEERSGARASEPPGLRTAGVVLIDKQGDQLWLGHAGTVGGTGRGGAIRILRDAGFDVGVDGVDTIKLRSHYVDGEPDPNFFLPYYQKHESLHLEGHLCASRAGAAVKTISADDDVDQSGILKWWDQATGPYSWLGNISRLMLFSSPEKSESCGYYGYQLIAVGSTGREAWIHFPGPRIYKNQTESTVRQELRRFEPVAQSMDAAIENIFSSAGFPIQLRDERNWVTRKLFPKERPDIISRP
ncbi:hypothetical protein [Kocuria rosea]|uniref:hypothetical protein n=1 Tax=Kocuria rosea TaxID=1275 RepID=UPI0025409933|nr:hypothetical protein [Kocuria rosea]WIG18384.1 hypothetical protein QOY29_05500 [Kocuria rosea]